MSNYYWENLGYWSSDNVSFDCAAKQLALWVGEHADLSRNSRLLDLGCGNGIQVKFWEQHFKISNIYGVEKNPIKLKNLGVLFEEKPNIFFRENLNLAEAKEYKFDRFVFVDCLYFFENQNSLIKNLILELPYGGVGVWTDFLIHDHWVLRPFLLVVSLLSNIPFVNWQSRSRRENFLLKFDTIEIQTYDLTCQVLEGYTSGNIYSLGDSTVLKVRKFCTRIILRILLNLKAIEYVGFQIKKRPKNE